MKAAREIDVASVSLVTLEEHARDVREERGVLRQLLEHPACELFGEAVRANSDTFRAASVGRRITSMDDALEHNYNLGLADGLVRAILLGGDLLEAYDQRLRELEGLIKEKADARRDTSNGADSDPISFGRLDVPDANGGDADEPDLFAP